MVMIRPFRALRYDPAAVSSLAAVVAPPYDVISPEYRERLYDRDPHNVIRLILNRDADPYESAARHLDDWRRSGVLKRDAIPALYYYVEDFTLGDGTARERAGIMGAVRLEPFGTGRIRPHERTFARAKADRMRLIQACHTNLSAIFGISVGADAALDGAKERAARRVPEIDLRDDAGERHRVWRIDDADSLRAIAAALKESEVLIADGHHRYETALEYRDRLLAEGRTDPEAAHNFVLMYVCSMSDPGLVIQPTHRVLRECERPAAEAVDALGRVFRLTSFPRSERQAFVDYLRAVYGRLGIALRGHEELLVAEAEDPGRIHRFVGHMAPVVRALDVAVLDRVVLRGLLDIDCTAAAQAGKLAYTHEDAAALDAVEQGAAAAFLLNPPRMNDVRSVCAAGETMPEKSTYFYPKLLSGLVFHPLGER